MQHCYSVACFDFLWMAEKSDYPLRFLLSREPSLLFSLRGFFNFQTRIQWIIQFELTVDKLNEKERFSSVPKYLSEKPGEFDKPILSVVNLDQHERCISINWKTAPFNFSFLKQEKYHLISKKHFICIGFEIHILFHCLLFRNKSLKKNWLFLQFSSLPYHHHHHPHRHRRHHLENALTWQQHIVAESHINLVSPTPPSL